MIKLEYLFPKIGIISLFLGKFFYVFAIEKKNLDFSDIFFVKNPLDVPKNRAFVRKMFGCVRFGFLDVFGRTTEHHRTAFFRPNTETEQMFGRSLPDNNLLLTFQIRFPSFQNDSISLDILYIYIPHKC